jgi:NAD(P)H-nitrite reductase large subunit
MSAEDMNRNKTYNVLPGTRMGVLTREYLEKLTGIAEKYDIPFFKITSAQRLAIVGHTPETAEKIWQANASTITVIMPGGWSAPAVL